MRMIVEAFKETLEKGLKEYGQVVVSAYRRYSYEYASHLRTIFHAVSC